MPGRIIEIAGEERYLHVARGFLVVETDDGEAGRVPLDDIAAVIVTARQARYSNRLVCALADRNALLIPCDERFRPVGWLWPLSGHYGQGGRMAAQAGAGRPRNKRLWQQIVRAKIAAQAQALRAAGAPHAGVAALAARVRSGDPDNVEAQAARRYWPLMMGPDFSRDRGADGANALLNYGYTVLRAVTARAIAAAGLHPTLGLHHGNRTNAMALADDLMEPFRPYVDLSVKGLMKQGQTDVSPTAKRHLAALSTWDMPSPQGVSPLMTVLHRLAASLGGVYEGDGGTLALPEAPTDLHLAALLNPDVSA
ncbi:type II CRISPR-associated endonuclease Cas1 [Eilatimonas milleporae]|uniref:CRISPR-associated endonuclease Cas1 n=1 Tax=Eilatimonas milleporae TaxID=911205 RepID=A0A3M0CGN8_9PROT|nr:type II CRISPR-associated endonuclease Cas1 [Eilatimonas milleporae]RMB07947.1 CRISPR-associated Cas1 family protein [Eilatimonas milleporae]